MVPKIERNWLRSIQHSNSWKEWFKKEDWKWIDYHSLRTTLKNLGKQIYYHKKVHETFLIDRLWDECLWVLFFCGINTWLSLFFFFWSWLFQKTRRKKISTFKSTITFHIHITASITSDIQVVVCFWMNKKCGYSFYRCHSLVNGFQICFGFFFLKTGKDLFCCCRFDFVWILLPKKKTNLFFFGGILLNVIVMRYQIWNTISNL